MAPQVPPRGAVVRQVIHHRAVENHRAAHPPRRRAVQQALRRAARQAHLQVVVHRLHQVAQVARPLRRVARRPLRRAARQAHLLRQVVHQVVSHPLHHVVRAVVA